MIVTIIILSTALAGSLYLFGKQYFKCRRLKAVVKQYDHAVKAFEELEGKIGEMERYYAKKKTELEKADNASDIADILNDMQNNLHRAKDHSSDNP